MDLGRYSKLIGAVLGNIVAIVIAYLATKEWAGATCTLGPDGTEACVLLGFTQAQITATLMTGVNALFVYAFPANRPAA
jgi:hypothetical protein